MKCYAIYTEKLIYCGAAGLLGAAGKTGNFWPK